MQLVGLRGAFATNLILMVAASMSVAIAQEQVPKKVTASVDKPLVLSAPLGQSDQRSFTIQVPTGAVFLTIEGVGGGGGGGAAVVTVYGLHGREGTGGDGGAGCKRQTAPQRYQVSDADSIEVTLGKGGAGEIPRAVFPIIGDFGDDTIIELPQRYGRVVFSGCPRFSNGNFITGVPIVPMYAGGKGVQNKPPFDGTAGAGGNSDGSTGMVFHGGSGGHAGGGGASDYGDGGDGGLANSCDTNLFPRRLAGPGAGGGGGLSWCPGNWCDGLSPRTITPDPGKPFVCNKYPGTPRSGDGGNGLVVLTFSSK